MSHGDAQVWTVAFLLSKQVFFEILKFSQISNLDIWCQLSDLSISGEFQFSNYFLCVACWRVLSCDQILYCLFFCPSLFDLIGYLWLAGDRCVPSNTIIFLIQLIYRQLFFLQWFQGITWKQFHDSSIRCFLRYAKSGTFVSTDFIYV